MCLPTVERKADHAICENFNMHLNIWNMTRVFFKPEIKQISNYYNTIIIYLKQNNIIVIIRPLNQDPETACKRFILCFISMETCAHKMNVTSNLTVLHVSHM